MIFEIAALILGLSVIWMVFGLFACTSKCFHDLMDRLPWLIRIIVLIFTIGPMILALAVWVWFDP